MRKGQNKPHIRQQTGSHLLASATKELAIDYRRSMPLSPAASGSKYCPLAASRDGVRGQLRHLHADDISGQKSPATVVEKLTIERKIDDYRRIMLAVRDSHVSPLLFLH